MSSHESRHRKQYFISQYLHWQLFCLSLYRNPAALVQEPGRVVG